MAERLNWTCHVCGNEGFSDGDDGFFYCSHCGSQAEDIIDTAVAEEDLFQDGQRGGLYSSSHRRSQAIAAEPVSQYSSQPRQSQFWDSIRALGYDDHKAADGVGPIEPTDFGSAPRKLSYDDYYTEIRLRYVMGVQILIQLQCKALVQEFHVSPLIIGLVPPIWLRFVSSTRVLADEWADEVIHESESQKQGQVDYFEPRAKYRAEPHNILGQRAVMLWYRSLSKTIPLYYSLVISFLLCHVAREAILPTDILKWTVEGKLPYFAAFVEIEKQLGPPSAACPLSASSMFRPKQVISLQKLESLAASVSQTIGLDLPPVNFYAIASRYLRQLCLPVERILPQACRIHEWSMPSELYLSVNESRLPTRVCVISILILTIRILYNINGFGKWELSLSSSSDSSSLGDQNGEAEPTGYYMNDYDAKEGSPSHNMNYLSTDADCNPLDILQSEFDAAELLQSLEANYNDYGDTYEYSKDLLTYLQYCKDVVFAGMEPSFNDQEEGKIIDELWDFYQNRKGSEPSNNQDVESLGCGADLHNKRLRDEIKGTQKDRKKFRDDSSTFKPMEEGDSSREDDCSLCSVNMDNYASMDQNSPSDGPSSVESHKDGALRRLKSSMEENRFCYMPPRLNTKRFEYLHYARKIDDGAYMYVAHADYYIILRSFAKAAQVDVRSMHSGVLSFERSLAWLEKRMDYCLHVKPPIDSCDFCRNEAEQSCTCDDSMGPSKLNL